MVASSLKLGKVELFLPDASDPDFWFGHDIADLLRRETNAEARAVLEEAIRQDAQRPRGKLDVDHEADAVWFRARRPDRVVHAAQVLHRLAGLELTAEEVASVLEKARAAAPLSVHDILEFGLITILHTDGTCLDSNEFVVLGHVDPFVDPASGPWREGGTSTSDRALVELANAWYGLAPWNVLHREDYWDKLLYRGKTRPSSALVLSTEERKEYRRNHLGVEE